MIPKIILFRLLFFFLFLALILTCDTAIIRPYALAIELIAQDDFEDGNFDSVDPNLTNGLSWLNEGQVTIGTVSSYWQSKCLKLNIGSRVFSNQLISSSKYTLTFDYINYYKTPSKVQFFYIDNSNYYYFAPANGKVFRVMDGIETQLSDLSGIDTSVYLFIKYGVSINNFKIYFENTGSKIIIQIDRDGYQNGLDYEFTTEDTNPQAVNLFKNNFRIGFTEDGSGNYSYWVNYDNINIYSDKVTASLPRNPTTIYVSPNGDDNNSGTISQPLATIAKALDLSLPGDTILVKDGFYNESIDVKLDIFTTLKVYATSDKRLTIKSENKHGAKIKGVDLSLINFVTVDGFDVNGSISMGGLNVMYRTWYSRGARVINNFVHDGWGIGATAYDGYVANNYILRCNRGVGVGGDNMLVENNEIERLIYRDRDADYFRFFGTNHTIRNNYMHGTRKEEVGGSHTDGFQTFGDNGECAKNIIIENNFIKDWHGQSFMITGEAGCHENIIIRNNVCIAPGAWGIDACGIKNLRVYNNIFVNVGYHGIGFEERLTKSGEVVYTTGEIKNNIFYNAGSDYWTRFKDGLQASNNLIYHTDKIVNQSTYPNDIVNQDPLFVDISNYNFHLRSDSPAIDRGATLTDFSYDKDGISRPQGAAWDIGAYEYSSGFLYGDTSGDNQISAYDAALAAQYSVGLISLTQEQIQKADVSGDKQVTAYDAALIAQRAVGLIGKFPVEG